LIFDLNNKLMSLNIAILAGGDSSESVISLQSAEQVRKLIGTDFNTYTIYVKATEWTVTSDEFCDTIVNKDDFSFKYNNQKIKFDFALIAIHGTPGEDGKLQAYFELLGIPYSTPDSLISAVTFNKYYCKAVLDYEGINSAKAYMLRTGDEINIDKIINKTQLPCFVKPNAGGSSFGISKVKTKEDLLPAIKKAFAEDNEVIIEQFIDGIEVTCGCYEYSEGLQVLPPTEIDSENEFFDYEAKYEGKSTEITPARINKELTDKVQNRTKEIYKILNCKGVVRVDYIIENNEPIFIEINTVPGMSSESIIPQQLKEQGIEVKKMYNQIIEFIISKSK
jgi:D-alanine-D-alanine ligase